MNFIKRHNNKLIILPALIVLIGCYAYSSWATRSEKYIMAIEKDIRINYNQEVNGYRVFVIWKGINVIESEPFSATISLTKDGETINVNVDDFGDSTLLYKMLSDTVYNIDYTAPDPRIECYSMSHCPFAFKDVDFDGEPELLVNDWSMAQCGNSHIVYKLRPNVRKMEYPFSYISDSDSIDQQTQTLIRYSINGAYNSIWVTYKNDRNDITDTMTPPKTVGWCGESVCGDINQNRKSKFKVDSFVEYIGRGHDNVGYHYYYKRKGNKLSLVKTQKIQ